MTTTPRAVGRWLVAWAVMLLLTVMIGGITRLTNSGLSITEWKPISGVVPPLGETAWEEAFAKYREIPEYRAEHASMELAEFKRIYLWEYFHRLWARAVGLALVIPMAIFWRRGWLDARLKRRVVVLLALVGAQATLGWFMVQSGLTILTDVSHYRLAAHLGLALVIVAITVATATDLLALAEPPSTTGPTAPVVWAWAGVVFVTAVAGALVAGLDAGTIFNEFPKMGGRWIPLGYGRLTPWWLNALADPVAAQFHHRVVATITAATGLAVGWAAMRANGATSRLGFAIVVGVVVQFSLGVATLLQSVPLGLAVAHQGLAVILFACAVALAVVRRGGSVARRPGLA